MHVLVTGANGFIGRIVCETLAAMPDEFEVSGAIRREVALPEMVRPRLIEPIGPKTEWLDALFNVDAVVHLAARAHVMEETAKNPLAQYRKVNALGTRHLAEQAAASGVKRFVYVSTVKVHGQKTNNHAFTEDMTPEPADDYAVSKLEAERYLQQVASDTGMDVVVLRPPLVYGPGVKGNMLKLMDACFDNTPLPFAKVDNKRSLLAAVNLADAISLCLVHPSAPGRTFLISDGETVSTPDLLRKLGEGLERPPRLIAAPPGLVKVVAKILGKGAMAERLTESLVVDDSLIRQTLGWTPPRAMDEELRRMTGWYIAQRVR